MEARLQRRIQRYAWDRAARDYEPLWRVQLAGAHAQLLAYAALAPGERVLDVACGTGLVTFAAAAAVGPRGEVVGVDLAEQMIEAARRRATARAATNTAFARMDAEQLALPAASFDVALCAFGLMFMPDPERAVLEMRRVVRPGGRIAIAAWGERARCQWAESFPIIDAEVTTEVCPLFFRMGQGEMLARACATAGFAAIEQRRLAVTMDYENAEQACCATFNGGPFALAWSRFDDEVRTRVRTRYLQSIAPWQRGDGYRIPAEFVVVAAVVPEA